MSDRKYATLWLPCATLHHGNEVPVPVRAWDEALEDGWEPAGPSMTVQTTDVIVTFAMVKRPLSRLNLVGFETVREVQ
jgi:hypothetical protein